MAECKETVATMLDVQVQTAGGYAAAAKRGEAARPARQAATGNVRVPERAAEAAPTPAEAELMRAPVLRRQEGEGGGGDSASSIERVIFHDPARRRLRRDSNPRAHHHVHDRVI